MSVRSVNALVEQWPELTAASRLHPEVDGVAQGDEDEVGDQSAMRVGSSESVSTSERLTNNVLPALREIEAQATQQRGRRGGTGLALDAARLERGDPLVAYRGPRR